MTTKFETGKTYNGYKVITRNNSFVTLQSLENGLRAWSLHRVYISDNREYFDNFKDNDIRYYA